jgi:hypothetical protein
LNEVRGEVSLLAEFLIERIPCSCVGRDALCVRNVRPTELGSTVGAVKELASGFVEIIPSLVGNDKLDRRGTADLHISDVSPTVLKYSEAE